MSEVKDPAIKLFGRTIQLPEIQPPEVDAAGTSLAGESCRASGDDGSAQDQPCTSDSQPEEGGLVGSGEEQAAEKEPSRGNPEYTREAERPQPSTSKELVTTPAKADGDSDAGEEKSSKTEEAHNETSNAEDKHPKKPEKILPCPRCNSMETKFCYFNNYNVNQPRHFCRNCQRYWTAGGTMRNVPVGAGRRKNKNSASSYRHLTIPPTLHVARPDLPNGVHHPTVLAFRPDTPLCESMASVLNIGEKALQNCSSNGYYNPEEASFGSGDNTGDISNGSSGSSRDDVGKTRLPDVLMQSYPNFPAQLPCFPGAPWPYPWNPVQWGSTLPPPGFCPPGFPMPFYPAPPYLGCAVPGTWNVPWMTPPATSSSPNSPTLGKHSRDEGAIKPNTGSNGDEPLKESDPEKCLWVPKTLRIDDPGEAAKSSIWATLGIKSDDDDSVTGGLFKAFRTKDSGKSNVPEASTVLQANPAALSRSLSFHERS